MIKLLSIADSISLINGCLGFLAVIILFSNINTQDIIRISFSLILLALLADGLDGIIARKTHISELGGYLEAMADMISMGIAPSAFVFKLYNSTISSEFVYQILFILTLVFFIICSFIRLSSFHIMKNETYFFGIPASASTIFLLVAAYFEIDFVYILLLIVILSLATISRIRFPKPGLRVNTMAFVMIVSTLIFGEAYYKLAPLLLLIALAIYVLIGPFYVKKQFVQNSIKK
jgi:CDP-diacylglycerol--serine O-phosphatidyltransferase